MIKKPALALIATLLLFTASPARSADEGTISMNFANADITMVIKYISEMTGRNFVVNDKVQGKVTILSPKKVTRDEAYKVFESILSVYGFSAVPSGNVVKIVPVNDARQLGGTMGALLTGEMRDQMITQLIPLKFVTADNMVNALRPLIPPTSYIASYQQSNTLIIVDLASNLERINTIIGKLDVEGRETGITVAQLKHASARDIAAKITNVTGKDPARGGAVDPNANVLPDDRLNAIIIVGNELYTNKVKNIIGQLDIESPPGRQEINVVYLSNANAEDLAKVVNQILQAEQKKTLQGPQAQEAVFVTADKPTNAIIVTASPEQFVNVKRVIEKLDIPRRQVFVEALIFEVREDKAKKFGVEWRTTSNFNQGGVQGIGGTNFGTINQVAANPITGMAGAGMVVGVVDGTIDVGGTQYANVGGLISALQTDTDVNILSTPNILTTDNEEAKIFVGQNVPFLKSSAQTTGGTPVVNVDRQDIGTVMKITPQINENNQVRLKIYQETSSISPTQLDKAQDIITFKRTAETVVVVRDKQNIIIGGLISENLQDVENKVPLLGSIPLLGWLFKSKSKSVVKTNLLIFLTPHIINNVEDMKRVTDSKLGMMDKLSGPEMKEKIKERAPTPPAPEQKSEDKKPEMAQPPAPELSAPVEKQPEMAPLPAEPAPQIEPPPTPPAKPQSGVPLPVRPRSVNATQNEIVLFR
ncbi:MAG: type II secretion system secretin GspD [Nitrospinae bacterium]|nr:type II secretion system secretin GspD [Nitrospinota bacterium]